MIVFFEIVSGKDDILNCRETVNLSSKNMTFINDWNIICKTWISVWSKVTLEKENI